MSRPGLSLPVIVFTCALCLMRVDSGVVLLALLLPIRIMHVDTGQRVVVLFVVIPV